MLWHDGLRYRLHRKDLPGKPDIVLPRWRAAVLVHGCFWHWHQGCRLFKLPSTRVEFWQEKLAGNRRRDDRTIRELELTVWRVAVVWECAIRDNPDALRTQLLDWIRHGSPSAQFCGRDGAVIQAPLS
jgi:DNA mismatch endonuclease (patch repair protein)